MSDQNFQVQVTNTLARLETKMDLLVGSDGTGGWKSNVDERLENLESERERKKGRIQWLERAVTAGLGAGVVTALQKIFHL